MFISLLHKPNDSRVIPLSVITFMTLLLTFKNIFRIKRLVFLLLNILSARFFLRNVSIFTNFTRKSGVIIFKVVSLSIVRCKFKMALTTRNLGGMVIMNLDGLAAMSESESNKVAKNFIPLSYKK